MVVAKEVSGCQGPITTTALGSFTLYEVITLQTQMNIFHTMIYGSDGSSRLGSSSLHYFLRVFLRDNAAICEKHASLLRLALLVSWLQSTHCCYGFCSGRANSVCLRCRLGKTQRFHAVFFSTGRPSILPLCHPGRHRST